MHLLCSEKLIIEARKQEVESFCDMTITISIRIGTCIVMKKRKEMRLNSALTCAKAKELSPKFSTSISQEPTVASVGISAW